VRKSLFGAPRFVGSGRKGTDTPRVSIDIVLYLKCLPNQKISLPANLTLLQTFIRVTFIIAVFSATGCSSRTATPELRYVPAGDLLDIVKDFQRLAREDTYRFPIPKDVTGVNIMKATLVRLEDYEKKNPGKFTDIVQFNKALALERLREYDRSYPLSQGSRNRKSSGKKRKNAVILEYLKILDRHYGATIPSSISKVSMKRSPLGTSLSASTRGPPTSFSRVLKKSALIAPRFPSSRPIGIASRKGTS
jgi:hypothetical protein